jgi:hypothetical protein
MTITDSNLEEISKLFQELSNSIGLTNSVTDSLVKADEHLYEIIKWWETWPQNHQAPSPKAIDDSVTEHFEGIVLFALHNPTVFFKALKIPVPADITQVIKLIIEIINPPASKIQVTDFENCLIPKVKSGTAVDNHGRVYNTYPYEQMDLNWLYAMVNTSIIRPVREYLHEDSVTFGKNPYIASDLPTDARIGIIGDWGTGFASACGGRTPAKDVLTNMMDKNIDYLIHLGDTYYSGTPQFKNMLLPPSYLCPGEEVDNLINCWPSLPDKHSFTLNSNHDMFCGGVGYFSDLVTSGTDPLSPFGHQNATSYFLLSNSKYQLFGLDSSYFATPPHFLGGTLGGTSNTKQSHFIRDNYDSSKTQIVFTHHPALNFDGDGCTDLWDEVGTAYDENTVGTDNEVSPDYWYFGHNHNGVVYANSGRSSSARNRTNARLIGHSAIPHGFPRALANADDIADTEPGTIPTSSFRNVTDVEWFAHDQATTKCQNISNGFAVIQLGESSVTEEYYNEAGQIVWSSAASS